jgi:hypothetical protein
MKKLKEDYHMNNGDTKTESEKGDILKWREKER